VEHGPLITAFAAAAVSPPAAPKRNSVERNGAVSAILNNISDLILGCLCNFVIKPPETIVIRPLYFSVFSDLVLGFELFQLSP